MSRSPGVVRPVPRKEPPLPVTSRQLKFGVDRILSADISPSRPPPRALDPSTVHAWRCPPLAETGAGAGTDGVPCSECVSSLLRCCSLGPPPHMCEPACFPGYCPSVLTPRALRPYTNLLVVSEAASRSSPDQPGAALPSPGAKRKRSWSRAVFSNLQRKGLEKRFQLQKYITKPDRRQLAATLGLTDAQVKVWFQNRRMKWRHSKEGKPPLLEAGAGAGARDDPGRPDSTQDEDLIDVHTVDS